MFTEQDVQDARLFAVTNRIAAKDGKGPIQLIAELVPAAQFDHELTRYKWGRYILGDRYELVTSDHVFDDATKARIVSPIIDGIRVGSKVLTFAIAQKEGPIHGSQ